MTMMVVEKGTEVKVIKKGKEWFAENFKTFVTTKTNVFGKEDIIVDPVGKLGCHRGDTRTVGGRYAQDGWYGFADPDSEYIMLVHSNFVTCA